MSVSQGEKIVHSVPWCIKIKYRSKESKKYCDLSSQGQEHKDMLVWIFLEELILLIQVPQTYKVVIHIKSFKNHAILSTHHLQLFFSFQLGGLHARRKLMEFSFAALLIVIYLILLEERQHDTA